MGEGAARSEARCHPDRTGVDAAGRWGESHASFPGDLFVCQVPVALRGVAQGKQKSAEAVLAASARQ